MFNNLSLHCLKYAESVLPENMVFDGGDRNKKIPISFVVYLIEAGDRKILIDAGCDTMPGFEMKKYYSPAFVVRNLGFAADDITDVVITHAHHDHIEAVKHFRNAVVHITEEEYLNGKKYIQDNMVVNVFKEDYNILPQVKIIKWCGHSEGSVIVEITDNEKIHILAGDECYTNENIENKICTGIYFNKNKSIEFVEKYSNKKYMVHTTHDISLKDERII